MVKVAYERFQLYIRALSGKNLVFWIGGHLRKVVAYGGSTALDFCSLFYLKGLKNFIYRINFQIG